MNTNTNVPAADCVGVVNRKRIAPRSKCWLLLVELHQSLVDHSLEMTVSVIFRGWCIFFVVFVIGKSSSAGESLVYLLILRIRLNIIHFPDTCEIPNQVPQTGECKDPIDCPAYLQLRHSSNLTVPTISFLRQINCPKPGEVCCPVGQQSSYQ